MEKSCTFDLTDEKAVVQHIRDLLNLAELLEKGFDEELRLFIKSLSRVGWGSKRINELISYAGSGTRYEHITDEFGRNVVPRPIPERGDQKEWRRIKSLHQK